MNNIYVPRHLFIDPNELLSLCDGAYTYGQFRSLLSGLFGDGRIKYESFYFLADSEQAVMKGLKTMIFNLEEYIGFRTPGQYFQHIRGDIKEPKKPKTNRLIFESTFQSLDD
jgi:hypothetical protein